MKSLVGLIVAVLAVPALGEVVYLNDGTKLEGELRRTNDGWVVTDSTGKSTAVAQGQVKSIVLKKAPETPETADQRLASLRRATANLRDPREGVQRFKNFIAQNPGTPAAQAARQDLAAWQQRLDQGLIKAGDQWVTRQQLAEIQAKTLQTAQTLRTLINSGKLNQALAELDKELNVSPHSPALLYLKGVVLYRQSQLVPARNAFQDVETQLPDDAAVHNNIAVILWKTRAMMPALAEYDKAMLADPQNRQILDNVAEALNALPAEHRKNDLTRRVVARFNQQDALLQKAMASRGLYRWGSQWVSEADYNKIQAAEKLVRDKIAAMQKDFDETQTQLLRLSREIQDDRQIQQVIASQSIQLDPVTGRMYQLPLPQRYYDLDRDIRALQVQQATKQQQLQDLQRQAAQVKKNLPTPKYTGTQTPFDVEAMPGGSPSAPNPLPPVAPPPVAPTTAPAPAPTTGPTTAPAGEGIPPAVPKISSGGDFAPAPQP